MMDFYLKQNDLAVVNGDFALCANDTEASAQTIAIRLKTLAGEWFMDEKIGVPYLSQILGKKREPRLLRRLIAKEIQSVPNVKEIKEFNFDDSSADRSVTIKFKAQLTDQSTVSINESIGV